MNNSMEPAEREEELYPFLARQVALYAGMDSTSVPKGLAQELFSSVSFLLTQGRQSKSRDLQERFDAGLSAVRQKIEHCKELWRLAWESLPPIENIALNSTLTSIGSFWKRYDCRFFAHQIPCDIDYQLCHPVSEELQGVDYVNQYLTHLLLEHDFLNRFDPLRVKGLLTAYCKDYRGLLINLYEPVATNALALALVGGDVAALTVAAEQRKEIAAAEPRRLVAAAEKLSDLLLLSSGAGRRYLAELAVQLLPRIRATNLDGIFLTFQ